jgi:hypothetical protein
LTVTTVARLTGHYNVLPPAPSAVDPVSSSQTWLATHDYRFIAELQGTHVRNVTVVRHGDIVRGDVLTMDAGEQTGYHRFRIRAGDVETTTTGALAAAHWVRASPAQSILVNHVTDPRWMLAPFRFPAGLRDLGQSGDTEMCTTRSGDRLVTADGQPLRVITHDVRAAWSHTFQIEPPSP